MRGAEGRPTTLKRSIAQIDELNGDLRLSPTDRVRYLAQNLWRNCRPVANALPATHFCRGRVVEADGTPSAYRFMGQVFIRTELPRLLPRSEIRVLDVGCGGGRMSDLLADAGFRGTYVGVDISDRFVRDTDGSKAFSRRFIHGDAHDLPESETYDLVFSNSALEHIPEDRRLLAKLNRLVAPGGMQAHIIPGGWALPLYLWHGYRQYSSARIAALFARDRAHVYRFGGLACFSLHFVVVTIGEILFRLKVRDRFPRAYRALLNRAIAIDQALRICSGMSIVCQVVPPSPPGMD